MSDVKLTKPRKPKDEVFRDPQSVTDFEFGEKVASVFDDMLDRSVPFYQEIQRMIAEMARDFAAESSNIYDLGCSTGNTLLNLDAVAGESVTLIGVDYSEEMLKRCRDKLAASGFKHKHELICADLNQGIRIENASMVAMVLTLQFVRPLYRDTLTKSILQGRHGGSVETALWLSLALVTVGYATARFMKKKGYLRDVPKPVS